MAEGLGALVEGFEVAKERRRQSAIDMANSLFRKQQQDLQVQRIQAEQNRAHQEDLTRRFVAQLHEEELARTASEKERHDKETEDNQKDKAITYRESVEGRNKGIDSKINFDTQRLPYLMRNLQLGGDKAAAETKYIEGPKTDVAQATAANQQSLADINKKGNDLKASEAAAARARAKLLAIEAVNASQMGPVNYQKALKQIGEIEERVQVMKSEVTKNLAAAAHSGVLTESTRQLMHFRALDHVQGGSVTQLVSAYQKAHSQARSAASAWTSLQTKLEQTKTGMNVLSGRIPTETGPDKMRDQAALTGLQKQLEVLEDSKPSVDAYVKTAESIEDGYREVLIRNGMWTNEKGGKVKFSPSPGLAPVTGPSGGTSGPLPGVPPAHQPTREQYNRQGQLQGRSASAHTPTHKPAKKKKRPVVQGQGWSLTPRD